MKVLESISRDNFLKNSSILIIGNIVAGFLGYLFHLLISKKLSIESYGELQTLSSLLNILAVPTMAINFFVIKHSSIFFAKNDYFSSYQFSKWINKNIIILTLVISAIFILIAPIIKYYLHLNGYLTLFLIIIIIDLGLLASTPKGILNGWHDFKNLSINNILGAIIKLIFGVTLVFIFATTVSALLGILAGTLFSYIYLVLILKKDNFALIKAKVEAENSTCFYNKQNIINEIKQYILPICSFSFFLTLLTSFDMLMVKNLASPELAGFYGAFNILSKIIFWASSSVVLVVLPMACAKNSVKEILNKKILVYANALIVFICTTSFLAYYFFPSAIVSLLFGHKYIALAHSLWAFALMALSLSLLNLEANLAYARYDFKISYILLATIILEIFFVYILSQNLLSIALTIAITQFLGYLASHIYNKNAVKKCMLVYSKDINI